MKNRKINLKNSTIFFIGILIISIGVFFMLFEYFKEKKYNAFSTMNILLYENEQPEKIEEEIEPTTDPIEQIPEEPEKEEKPKPTISYNYIGYLEIPKLNLKKGFVDINSRYNNIDYNVTIIKGSSFPTQLNGNFILAAHSGNCAYCYFNTLYKLNIGDEAYVYYNGIKYLYVISNIYNVEKTGQVAIKRNTNKTTLTLITCTRNSDHEQTVYILDLYNTQNY